MEQGFPSGLNAASKRLFVCICLVQFSVFGADLPAAHVRNFGKVNDHIYRGGEPSMVGLQELGAMGVKLVIDLRETGEGTNFERQQVEALHMKYVNIPFAAFSAPTEEQMRRVLSLLLHDDSDPVFVHCRRGKDRTGTVVACYRIEHDHWDNQSAFSEAKRYGMSMAEHGMRSYILHFSPLAIADAHKGVNQPAFSGLAGTPAQP